MRHLSPAAIVWLSLCLVPAGSSMAGCYDSAIGPKKRFVLSSGEAFDTATGLTWQRCSLGMKWSTKQGCTGDMVFETLDGAIEMAKAAGPDWRVPSGPELESIIEPRCGSPVVDRAVFPDIRPDAEEAASYWSTNAVGMANLFYFFDFMTGRADGHSRGFQLAVRLVRSAPAAGGALKARTSP